MKSSTAIIASDFQRTAARYWRRTRIAVFCFALVGASHSLATPPDDPRDGKADQAADGEPAITAVWANSGEDKVTRDELRQRTDDKSTHNSIWNGKQVDLFAARNETVAFNLVLEAAEHDAERVEVSLPRLAAVDGSAIEGRPAPRDELFDYRGRNIELFYVRYLKIEGLSILAYHHYDERHIPRRLRRPHNAHGDGEGTWQDRPDHDKEYPDIAAPLELHPQFRIQAGTNQSIWCDIFVPKETPPGAYRGEATIKEGGKVVRRIPVVLDVGSFTLPDLPTARTMLYIGAGEVNRRYLKEAYPHDYPLDKALNARSRKILDRHFQLAHRHRISLIDDYTPIERMGEAWVDRLSGALFSTERGYAGPGVGVGNNVYGIGVYKSWPWHDAGEQAMRDNSDAWVRWFERKKFTTPTDFFLYLIDESQDYDQIETWAKWLRKNPGPGARLASLATLPAPAVAKTPSLSIALSSMTVGEQQPWRQAVGDLQHDPGRRFWMYNGFRPASGCLSTEDDGVALREVAWGQFKMGVPRWFLWEGTYYNNYQGGQGETNVYQRAQTFGGRDRVDPVLGRTGWNCNNGDGVLFYPGVDTQFPEESYGIDGPIASLRLKHWRRGLQDFEYLTAAHRHDAGQVQAIVAEIVPRILWEIGVDNPSDPTYVHCDPSWSANPNDWERARKKLAAIIAGAAPDK